MGDFQYLAKGQLWMIIINIKIMPTPRNYIIQLILFIYLLIRPRLLRVTNLNYDIYQNRPQVNYYLTKWNQGDHQVRIEARVSPRCSRYFSSVCARVRIDKKLTLHGRDRSLISSNIHLTLRECFLYWPSSG